VGKILKDPRFLECVGTTAGVAAIEAAPGIPQNNIENLVINDRNISIDWTRTEDHSNNPVPERFDGRTLTLVLGVNTDAQDSLVLMTYPNEYSLYQNRLPYETCISTKDWTNNVEDYDNSVTDVEWVLCFL
jgi:hypothetical protein